ncbi:MAG TPA: prolyl oligopeptidase family serine peptidase, partial [Roseimicrobium sp.]|nr:prolyl oligopeptidase family serine peptidase [Roseimicrobium sp.]
ADFTTVVQQAAADKWVKNVFNFNNGDPYSNLTGARLDDKEKALAVSPVHYVSKDNPPFLILHGTADQMVPFAQTVEFADALKKARVEVLVQKFPNVGHGGGEFWSAPVTKLMYAFFNKHLKGIDAKLELVPEKLLTAKPAK